MRTLPHHALTLSHDPGANAAFLRTFLTGIR
jgi:hypothetical protein